MTNDNIEAATRLLAAYDQSTAGAWRKGISTHHTVTDLPNARNYKIGEFHHADDANFCDVAHELVPMLCRAILSRTPAPSEPVAWMWQHEETGNVGFVDPWQVANGWQAANPRNKIIKPLFDHPAAPVAAALPDKPRALIPPSAMDWVTSRYPRFAVTQEWLDGWDACRNHVTAACIAAPAQSADMVLVPRVPTRTMIDAAVASWAREGAGSASAYRAMLAAAAGAPTNPVHEAAPQSGKVHSGSAPANAPSGEGSAQQS